MNPHTLRESLFELTETEIFFKENPNAHTKEKAASVFPKVKTPTGEEVYLFTFEGHKRGTRKKGFTTSPYLHGTEVEIVKHARYSKTPLHIHSFVEMIYIYSGKASTLINGQEISLKEGDFCLLNPHVPHTILPTGEQDILINLLMSKEYFSAATLNRLSHNGLIFNFLVDAISNARKKDQFIIFHGQSDEGLKTTFEHILWEYHHPTICSKEVIDAYIVILFSGLLRVFKKQSTKESQSKKQLYLGDILHYIEEHHESCSLQSVSDHFNFNASYLSRYIKKQTGKNFKDLVQKLRFDRACTLLQTSTLPIEEIAHQIGYSNIGFFYQTFQKLYGQSPNDYRQQHTAT